MSSQVRLVSEHLHCEDYIIRSFIMQNTRVRGGVIRGGWVAG